MSLHSSKLLLTSVFELLKRVTGVNGSKHGVSQLHLLLGNYQAKSPDKNGPKNKVPFTTRLALPEDYDYVVNFMAETFFKEEPSYVNIGLSENSAPSSIRNVLFEEVKEGLTIIAQSPDRCIIGAATNVVNVCSDPDEAEEFAKNCCEQGLVRDVLEFWAFVTREPNLWERYCVQKIFVSSCLGVSAKYRGFGIGSELIKKSYHLACSCGYRMFRIDCSNM